MVWCFDVYQWNRKEGAWSATNNNHQNKHDHHNKINHNTSRHDYAVTINNNWVHHCVTIVAMNLDSPILYWFICWVNVGNCIPMVIYIGPRVVYRPRPPQIALGLDPDAVHGHSVPLGHLSRQVRPAYQDRDMIWKSAMKPNSETPKANPRGQPFIMSDLCKIWTFGWRFYSRYFPYPIGIPTTATPK